MSKFRLKVVKPNKVKEPFMRGALTHSLVQRGMSFKKAYKIAQEVKKRLEEQDEVTSRKLNEVVEDEIRKRYGQAALDALEAKAGKNGGLVQVVRDGSYVPFSKGLLTKSITATGIVPSRAHQLAQQIEVDLHETDADKIALSRLHKRVYDKILDEYGKDIAQTYQLVRRLNHLDRPVIIYIGGAGGTGKSTLATDLATRLGILKVTGTDMIRQIMRIVFTKEILPSIHSSSFDAGQFGFQGLQGENMVIAGYTLQSAKVCVGVHAVVQRAIQENLSVIIEGVHLLPSLIQFPKLQEKAYHIPVILSLVDEQMHRARLEIRSKQAQRREARRYTEKFTSIRLIHEYFMEVGNQYDVDIINNENYDEAINELCQIVINNLQKQLTAKRSHHK